MIASRLVRSGIRFPINRNRWCSVETPVLLLCRQLSNGGSFNNEALIKWLSGNATVAGHEKIVQIKKRQVDNKSYGRKRAQDTGVPFLFAINNDNPTQAEVDAYFCENPDPNPEQVVGILQRTVKWKKKKAIDVLTGENLPIVISSLQRMLPKLNRQQLRHATIGTVECLQVISSTGSGKSGSWHTLIWSLFPANNLSRLLTMSCYVLVHRINTSYRHIGCYNKAPEIISLQEGPFHFD